MKNENSAFLHEFAAPSPKPQAPSHNYISFSFGDFMRKLEKQNAKNFDANWLEEFEKNSAFYKKGVVFAEKLNREINGNSLVLLKRICKINDIFFEYFYDSAENKNNFLLIMDDGLYIELLAYHVISTKIFSEGYKEHLDEDAWISFNQMVAVPTHMVIDSKNRGNFTNKIKCSGTTETIDETQRFMTCLDGYIGVVGASEDLDRFPKSFSARIQHIAKCNLKALSEFDQKTISKSALVDIRKFSEDYAVYAIKEIRQFLVEFSKSSTDAPKKKNA